MIINGIILAAGASSRFKSDKLLHPWQGQPLILSTINKLKQLSLNRCYMVAPDNQLADLAKQNDLSWIANNAANKGISHSIRLAIQASSPCDGYLLTVGDQPLLSLDTLQGMLALFRSGDYPIVCAGNQKHYGNPCLFSHQFTQPLCQLQGDHGGMSIIKQHPDLVAIYQVQNPWELFDVDTPQTLQQLHRQCEA